MKKCSTARQHTDVPVLGCTIPLQIMYQQGQATLLRRTRTNADLQLRFYQKKHTCKRQSRSRVHRQSLLHHGLVRKVKQSCYTNRNKQGSRTSKVHAKVCKLEIANRLASPGDKETEGLLTQSRLAMTEVSVIHPCLIICLLCQDHTGEAVEH